jgi:hypothetical protein
MAEPRATLLLVANRGKPGGSGNHGVTPRRAVPEGATSAICAKCGLVTPVADLKHQRGVDGTLRPSRTCLACHRQQAREHALAAARLKRPKRDSVDSAPDHRPPIRVRLALERDRAAGLRWDCKRFAHLVHAACDADVDGDDWRVILQNQAPIYHGAYDRTGPPVILRLDLSMLDDREAIEVEHSSRAVA